MCVYVFVYYVFFNNLFTACSTTLLCNTTCLFYPLHLCCFHYFYTLGCNCPFHNLSKSLNFSDVFPCIIQRLNEKHQPDAVNKYIFHLCSVSTCFEQHTAHHQEINKMYTSRDQLVITSLSHYQCIITSHTISYYRSDNICWFVHFIDLLMMGSVLPETCRDWT